MRNIYLHGQGVRLVSRTLSEAMIPLGHSLPTTALPESGQALRWRERGAGNNAEATGFCQRDSWKFCTGPACEASTTAWRQGNHLYPETDLLSLVQYIC